MTARHPLTLDPDRLFPLEPSARGLARELYEVIRSLPILSLHGHVDAGLLATNEPFRSATQLFITDDHYVTRMMASQGVPLELFGWHDDSGRSEREVWRAFCRTWPAFRGTPSRLWLEYQLSEICGVHTCPSEESADYLFDEIGERLSDVSFRPRALFERFRIEVLATTDDPWSSLVEHETLRAANLSGQIIPTMRPDALFEVGAPGWPVALAHLENQVGRPIGTLEQLVSALAERRLDFRAAGATAMDHGAPDLRIAPLVAEEAERIFRLARGGRAPEPAEVDALRSHLLFEMALLSAEDGLVMQLHPGVVRDYDRGVAARFGANRGFDIPAGVESAHALRPLLERLGFDQRFRCIVYTLDETIWTRELAPLAGAYPALFLGAPWWFLDSPNGMLRYRRAVTETAGFANTAGFVDDTRAFLSIPARHDVARRIDAAFVAELVATGLIPRAEAAELAIELTVGIPRRVFRTREDSTTP